MFKGKPNPKATLNYRKKQKAVITEDPVNTVFIP